jgi:two-component system nitrogen regulation sensor histidine kinase GlnL
MNAAAEALLDVSLNKVRGLGLAAVLREVPVYERLLRRVVRGGESLTGREVSLRLGGGRTITVDCTVTPVVADGGGVLIELLPLDHHRRITREARLVAQTESVHALIRGLAHEIRNPLGGLRGAAQLLDRELVEAGHREYTRVIIREADRLRALLERMLGPRTLPRRRAVNVHEVTERVRVLVAAEAPDTIHITRDYDPSVPEVHADPELLIQATLNVARNAVQALNGTGSVTLRTRVRRRFNIGPRHHRLAVAIDIIDDGPGIPDALGERVFYPMVTGRVDGTGLGLSIAQSLVSRQGGLVEYNREGGETIFSILLPVEEKG